MRPRNVRIRPALACAALALLALASTTASADDSLGLYLGGGLGQANTKVDEFSFNESQLGWKAMVGLRPFKSFGAELEYVDFGHPSSSNSSALTNAHARASALSAMFYLPLPVPKLDVFAKAGYSRIRTNVNGVQAGVGTCAVGVPNCALFAFNRTDTQIAYGAGAQFHYSTLALRAEYQRFSQSIGDASFLSLALTWSF